MAGMAENTSPLAPTAVPPSQVSPFYEVKVGQNNARRGPLRFEEGIATDTDVPSDFVVGVQQGIIPAPGRPNHNANVYEKPAAEVMRERAHLGSAAWVEAPTYLQNFAGGTSNEAEVRYIQTSVSGGRYERRNPAQVND
jgi:hypothetical protein